MKSSTAWSLIAALVIIIAILGGLYYYTKKGPILPASAPMIAYTTANGTSTPISENLILGITNNGNSLGDFLSAYNGMTLYTYAPDQQTPGSSACTGSCAQNWPPYTVESKSDINVSAATSGTVGTITRADGTLQVTYNGAPLYFYIGDKSPGDTNGQGVGGVWYVAKP